MTVLMKVAQAGYLDLVNLFLTLGATVSQVDAWQRTTLHIATHSMNAAVVQKLVAVDAGNERSSLRACVRRSFWRKSLRRAELISLRGAAVP